MRTAMAIGKQKSYSREAAVRRRIVVERFVTEIARASVSNLRRYAEGRKMDGLL